MTSMQQVQRMIEQVNTRPLPVGVVYCGSTSKCSKQFQRAQLYDTIRPNPRMFLTIGCHHKSDTQLVQEGVAIEKDVLDLLHFQKISMIATAAQMNIIPYGEVCILDLTDAGVIYIGESTERELRYTQYLINMGYPLTIRYWSQEQEQVMAVLKDHMIG